MMTNFCQHLVDNILNVILGEQFVMCPGPSQNRREDEFNNLIRYQRIPLLKACQLLGRGLWEVAFFSRWQRCAPIRTELHTYPGNNIAAGALLAGLPKHSKRSQAKKAARAPHLPVEMALRSGGLLADSVWKWSWIQYKKSQLEG